MAANSISETVRTVRNPFGAMLGRTAAVWMAIWLGVVPSLHAADEVNELLPLVPSSANAVSVIRVRELLQSPRGQREGWAKSGEAKLLAGVEHLPLNVPLVLRAAHLVPDDHERGWSLSLSPWPKDVSVTQLARHEAGEVEMINGVATVHTARNGYFVRLKPETLGVLSPADRQDVSRWIRFTKENSTPAVSNFLRTAAANPAQIVLALDMEDMLDPKFVKTHLAASRVMSKRTAEIPPLGDWLAGLRGVQFTAKVEDKTQVEVRFDFASPVGPRGELFQRLLVEYLNERGAILDELPDAELLVEETTLRLRTNLSDESLRRIMTFLSSPSPATPAASTENENAAHPDAAATARYFHAIMQLLDDLEQLNRRAKDYVKTAVWHDNFAKKIEQLPVRGVDDELVRFGSSAAHHLRALAASLRGVPLKVNTLERTITYQVRAAPYSLSYDMWFGYRYVPRPGFVWTASNLAKVREQQATAIAEGAEERNKVWNLLQSERSEIRHKIVDRYGSAIEKGTK